MKDIIKKILGVAGLAGIVGLAGLAAAGQLHQINEGGHWELSAESGTTAGALRWLYLRESEGMLMVHDTCTRVYGVPDGSYLGGLSGDALRDNGYNSKAECDIHRLVLWAEFTFFQKEQIENIYTSSGLPYTLRYHYEGLTHPAQRLTRRFGEHFEMVVRCGIEHAKIGADMGSFKEHFDYALSEFKESYSPNAFAERIHYVERGLKCHISDHGHVGLDFDPVSQDFWTIYPPVNKGDALPVPLSLFVSTATGVQ